MVRGGKGFELPEKEELVIGVSMGATFTYDPGTFAHV